MKKIIVIVLVVLFSMSFVGCKTPMDGDSLSQMVKDEAFTNAYILPGDDTEKIAIDYDDLKTKDFFNSIMNSPTQQADDLPDVEPVWRFVMESDSNQCRIENLLGILYANYNDKWYEIKASKEDVDALDAYLVPEEKMYQLTIQNETSYEVMGLKETYKAKEEVEVKMTYDEAIVIYVYLDKELIGCLNGRDSIKFQMPEKDAVLTFTHSNEQKETYQLTVVDNFHLLVKPLEKEYLAGEEVSVTLAFLSGPKVGLKLNNEIIKYPYEVNQDIGEVFKFIMPNYDSILYVTWNDLICQDDKEEHHKWSDGIIQSASNEGQKEIVYQCQYCGYKKTQPYHEKDATLLEVTTYVEHYNYTGHIFNPSWNTYDEFCEKYGLKDGYYVIEDYDSYLAVYCNITGEEIEPLDHESGNAQFIDHVMIVKARIASNSSLTNVDYYFDKTNKKFAIEYTDHSGVADEVVCRCIDVITMPRTLFDELKIKELEVLVTKKITSLDRNNIQIETIIIALDEIIKENQLTDIQKREINCLKDTLEALKDMEDINPDDLKNLINID